MGFIRRFTQMDADDSDDQRWMIFGLSSRLRDFV